MIRPIFFFLNIRKEKGILNKDILKVHLLETHFEAEAEASPDF